MYSYFNNCLLRNKIKKIKLDKLNNYFFIKNNRLISMINKYD